MSVYIVAQLKFTRRELYDRYQARFFEVFRKFKGRLLVADEQPMVLEGSFERDKVIDFSIGYFWTGQKLMVKKGSNIKSLADMAGKRAGTTAGALALQNLLKAQPGAIGQTFEGYPEAFLAMQRGLVDAVVADVIILAGLRANAPNPGDYVIIGDSLGGGDYAIGVRENDSKWRDAINFALQDLWRDGTWDKIFERWIGPNSALKLTQDEIGFKMELWD